MVDEVQGLSGAVCELRQDEARDVATAVRKHHPGDKVSVVIVRGSDRKTVEATLVERSDVQ